VTSPNLTWELRTPLPTSEPICRLHALAAHKLREAKDALRQGKTVVFTIDGREVGRWPDRGA